MVEKMVPIANPSNNTDSTVFQNGATWIQKILLTSTIMQKSYTLVELPFKSKVELF